MSVYVMWIRKYIEGTSKKKKNRIYNTHNNSPLGWSVVVGVR